MNILNEIIATTYPDSVLSCHRCGSSMVTATENNSVGPDNPMGERLMVINCGACGCSDIAVSPDMVRETVKRWLVKKSRVYTCAFKFNSDDDELSFAVSTGAFGVAAYTEGFWLNSKLKFTVGDDARWWIPPHKIEYIGAETSDVRLSE